MTRGATKFEVPVAPCALGESWLPCVNTSISLAFLPTKVPAGPDWIREIKHVRLIVARSARACSARGTIEALSLIIGSALRNREPFVIDGEAVVLGAEGISPFAALHSRRHDE